MSCLFIQEKASSEMYFWSFFLIGALILGLRGDNVIKTLVQVPTDQWDLMHDVAEKSTTTLVRLIVVTRNNEKEVERLKKEFEQITDPTHHSYGNYVSYDEIHEMILPETEKNGKAIEQWAKKYPVRVAPTANKEFIVIEATADEIERMFQTKLHTYRHKMTGQRTLRATEYQLAEIIHHRIAYIEGLTRFPAISNRNEKKTFVPISTEKAKSNAPIIFRISSGFSKFLIYIQLICADGKQASNSLCSNDFKGFVIELRQDKNKKLVTREVPIADTNCQVCRKATAINAEYCTVFNLDNDSVLCRFFLNNETDIGNYEAYQITIRSIFKTKYSDKAAYPSPTEKVTTVTPNVLLSLYNVDDNKNEIRNVNSRQAIAGFQEYLNLNSFKSFARTYGKKFSLTLGKIYGRDYRNKTYDEGETSLDLQYMSAMGSRIPTDYISSPSNFDGFLIDFFVQLAILEHNKNNIVPLVYSISYAADEGEQGQTYVDICDTQFMKLGLTGKSILVSS
ncbi:unnamed protein product [Didymodactylos carnosus]|uniref:Peptidase S53 activation domain-containing protein n=1 Tax=Didymodactylos carnosus TaxID=1234261 RepID=A0A815XFB9_9BILA|nr:unnamed protein product [Didymodactylos carnosus]CAF4418246.1 unnamed protein product [Didymodactylos carnosus]